uniref:G_PROTEIN_RECEP_F1_2 domain-containing protein n=1 Tax=Elaeophora elaphi TaxID=1147741 RepID=A0A0R3S1J7_9BILA
MVIIHITIGIITFISVEAVDAPFCCCNETKKPIIPFSSLSNSFCSLNAHEKTSSFVASPACSAERTQGYIKAIKEFLVNAYAIYCVSSFPLLYLSIICTFFRKCFAKSNFRITRRFDSKRRTVKILKA